MIVAGPYDGVLTDVLAGQTIAGLVRESTYLWTVLRSRGDHPDIYSAMRRFSGERAWPPRLLLQSNRYSPGIQRHDTASASARSIDVVDWSIERGGGAEPFELSIALGSIRWSEGAILDLAGGEVEPGLQWWLPASPEHESMRYASRIFKVTGLCDGVDVDGFVGCDEVHLAPGRQNYIDDPITATHLSGAWCTWAAAYDDGTVEAGHVAFGRDGFGFALRADGSSARTTTRVSGVAECNDLGCPIRVTFDIDGAPWEFTADRRGCPVEPLPGPVRQAEGWFRRVGETRRPVVWCATPEVPARH
jgi:hypothetical protein